MQGFKLTKDLLSGKIGLFKGTKKPEQQLQEKTDKKSEQKKPQKRK